MLGELNYASFYSFSNPLIYSVVEESILNDHQTTFFYMGKIGAFIGKCDINVLEQLAVEQRILLWN